MTDALRVEGLTKAFGKEKLALDGLTFSVGKGEFKALLGPNGSGKSTTIKMCCNLLEPTSGTVMIDGRDISEDPVEALSRMGCVVETPALYRDRTPVQTLEYICRLRGMDRETSASETSRVLEIVGMADDADRNFGRLSKGMRQRLSLAQSLLGDPSILILDEPTSGLDPKGISEVEEILRGLNVGGMSILMSSHMLREVERTCQSYVFIRHGRKVREGVVGSGGTSEVVVTFTRPLDGDELNTLRSISRVTSIDGDTAVMEAVGKEGGRMLMRRIVSAGLPACWIRPGDDLEDLFMEGDGDVQ